MIPEVDALMREQINADEPDAAVAVVVDGRSASNQGQAALFLYRAAG